MNERPVALVTGASSGIGRACALALGATHEVWLTYHHGQAAAEAVVAQIRGAGGAARALALDAGDPRSIAAAHEAMLRAMPRPKLDALVANAGTFGRGYRYLLELEEDEWDEVWATNASGVIRLFTAFREALLPGGTIVNVSTISAPLGAIGYKSQAHYATSKAAIEGFFEAIGAAHEAEGLRCINLVPGLVHTRMLEDHFGAEIDAYREAVPMKRFAEPDEIGRLVAALIGQRSLLVRRIAACGGWIQKGWGRVVSAH
jgi:3-oxoacyl-[acyl-carrier protein] reductase